MVDIDVALARLRLATGQSESVQYGLRHRQNDLLALEQDVRLVVDMRGAEYGKGVVECSGHDVAEHLHKYLVMSWIGW